MRKEMAHVSAQLNDHECSAIASSRAAVKSVWVGFGHSSHCLWH